MKVVLQKAVIKLGTPGDIVEVKSGYAFNYLIPKGMALFASEENLADFEKKKSEILKEHEQVKAKASSVKESIEGKPLFMERPINDAGNLYAVVSANEVADLLNTQFADLKFEFTKNQVVISNKIRNYGMYDFVVILYNGVSAKLKLVIAGNRASGEEMLNGAKQ